MADQKQSCRSTGKRLQSSQQSQGKSPSGKQCTCRDVVYRAILAPGMLSECTNCHYDVSCPPSSVFRYISHTVFIMQQPCCRLGKHHCLLHQQLCCRKYHFTTGYSMLLQCCLCWSQLKTKVVVHCDYIVFVEASSKSTLCISPVISTVCNSCAPHSLVSRPLVHSCSRILSTQSCMLKATWSGS